MPIAVNRFHLNDYICSFLADYGWHDDGSDEEGSRLNDLVHTVGDHLDDFLNGEDGSQESEKEAA